MLKAYRFYVIESNDVHIVHEVIECRDAIFNENRFSLIQRPKDLMPSSNHIVPVPMDEQALPHRS